MEAGARNESSEPLANEMDCAIVKVETEFAMRLAGKIAIVVGAGQSPGEGLGNGRATVLRFAQEGAKVLAVDRDLASAEETAALAVKDGGACVAFEADVTDERTLAAAVGEARRRWGRVDILHYNVGVSIGGGDAPLAEISEAVFDRICAINLRGAVMAAKHVVPVMREQRSGAIINISTFAAFEPDPVTVSPPEQPAPVPPTDKEPEPAAQSR